LLPQQPVDLLVKPVTKKTTKLTAQAKEKVQKRMEKPPSSTANPVLQLETDPIAPLTKEKAATKTVEVTKAKVGTEEASLVDAGAEGGDKGVTTGEVTDPTMPTNDISAPAGSNLNELLIGTTSGLTDGDKSPSQGQIPSTFGVTLGFESSKVADEVVSSTNANSLWDDIWS
jgi:hypothetical protein